ncbi:PH domain-containing protein [Mycolicibacillus trivialis]|uniref:Low molecular weight protein antigen 6 PH domain-containing protein n=1 Tax=Mycolicibacillus trivialis TaxID=1798 RepID=A0A1X2EJI8_9MYCO|nr:PH domain-containing protein [Mycolicibacillus trivialis]ORX04110.1 hypothetical protein AWC30_10015 [Mycolicibacillus trivialis]
MTGPEEPTVCWAPPTAGIVAAGGAGLVLLTLGLLAVTDAPGRVLITLAGLGLLGFAVLSWRARPRLAVAGAELVVHGWFRTRRLTREAIALIRITEFQRIGRKTRLLEIETTDDDLVVFSRWDLGTDPVDVLDALTVAGFAGR